MSIDNQFSAASLLAGGWTAEDREALIAEYDLSDDEADALCDELADLEKPEKPIDLCDLICK